ncbi:MAG: hypothetical protein JO108_08095 [Acidobacteriaceae bacterium]|nr:hypothetical protein [Acidobacteriaceae bacterium]
MHALDQALDTLKLEFDAACSQTARAARAELTKDLNQFVRRLRQYQTENEWVSTLLDGASRFVRQAAIFELKNGTFFLRAETNLGLPADLSFPLNAGAAFMTATETKDPVMALRTSAEVTPALSQPASGTAHILPILNGDRVVAALFASDGELVDANALEMIAGIAAVVLERKANSDLHRQIAPPQSSTPKEPAAPRSLPPWAALSGGDRELHLKAQRFARVAVAEMELANPEGCKAGREQRNLYLYLKQEIERARATYRQQFITVPSMVDYLHLELLRTAAEGDDSKLGADYPGPLV